MYNVKKYIMAIIVMVAIASVALLMLGTLTYFYKWQADKAMIGIIVTYVLTGFFGGFTLSRLEKREYGRKKGIETLVLGTLFVLLLTLGSSFGFQIPFSFSSRFVLIWLLVICSIFGGMCVKR